jgi:hypothetical protein
MKFRATGAFKGMRGKTKGKKTKLMLWIDNGLLDDIAELKEPEMTRQEAIRQILAYHVEMEKNLSGL